MTPENLDRSVPSGTAQEFSAYVAERLGWYVYALRDPRDQCVFYIGKGMGNRVFQHAKAAVAVTEGSEPVSPKIAQILDIISSGMRVDAIILRHGIASEKAAYDVEAAIIDTMRLLDQALANDRFRLTNLVLGHQHATKGLVSADIAGTLYDAPTASPILAPSILFRIPDLWTPQMSSQELYEVTRGWWRVGPDPRERAEYAFAVSKGVVRGVYRIASWRERQRGDRDWEQDLGKKPRWGFDGEPALEMHAWLNRSVAHLFKTGEANPVKAININSPVEPIMSRAPLSFTVSDEGSMRETPENGRPPAIEPAETSGFALEATSRQVAGWRRKTGSLNGIDPWDDGEAGPKYVPLLWTLRPSPDYPAGWLPPDPRNRDGDAGWDALAAWWTPMLHLTRFQMGLRRPGAHLAWLRSDPSAAAAHSPLTQAQFTLMNAWWGTEAVEDFIAWAITSADNNAPTDGGIWRSDEAGPRLSEPEASRYQRRTESAQWQATWGGGYDPMHLSDHALVPFTTSPDPRSPDPDLNWPNENPRLTWQRQEESDGLQLQSGDYAGWYGELLARGRVLHELTLVKVVIDDFGPLGTFAIGAGMRPRMFAYPAGRDRTVPTDQGVSGKAPE